MSQDTTPVASPDLQAATAFWVDYVAARPAVARLEDDYTVESFGDSAELANALLHEVLHGAKRATAELVSAWTDEDESLPRIGSHWIACDGSGVPTVILRSIELRIATFLEVDERFAYDEGEDDRTLESWRREHAKYWTRTRAARGAQWSEDAEIVLERFRIVWPPEFAD